MYSRLWKRVMASTEAGSGVSTLSFGPDVSP